MSKTMAKVLETHPEPEIDNGYWYCTCGHDYGVDFTNADVAAHQADALSAAGFGLVADTKAEEKRDAATAGVWAVCDVWGAGGRATVRLSELSEIAKDITEGEWDQHIEWNLKDIARERARATKAAS